MPEDPGLESMEARTEKVVRWIEENVGGRVAHIDPQARWRPVWFAEVERGIRALARALA